MIVKTFNLANGAVSDVAAWAAERQDVKKLHLLGDGELENGRHGIIGNSQAIRSVLEQVRMVAPADATVLIQGETGTGKEIFAQAIHKLSRRRNAPLVTLNCAAIPAGLLESELFGHERGAFTGALTQRIGRFEMANGGTLFLDEIGEMTLDLQVKLLRVLQEQAFERLGSARTSHVDVRVVAATNRDLEQMVEKKEFRADLFYRLSVFPISLPALRDRSEDIPELVRYFVAKYAERMNKIVDFIPPETMEALVTYDWPGNVRQLQNFIERGVILSTGRLFQPPLSQLRRQNNNAPQSSSRKTLEDATRDHILQVLKETNGVVGGKHGAAALLGIARTTLVSKLRRLGLESAPDEVRSGSSARDQAFASVA